MHILDIILSQFHEVYHDMLSKSSHICLLITFPYSNQCHSFKKNTIFTCQFFVVVTKRYSYSHKMLIHNLSMLICSQVTN